MGIFNSILSSLSDKLSGQGSGNPGSGLADLGQQMLNQAVNKAGEKLDESVNSAKTNLENGLGRLKPINEKNYPDFQRDPQRYLGQEGILWFVRKDLEAAKYYYSGGKEGYMVSDRVQGNGPAIATPPFLMLKSQIESTELKASEMEKAKGYEFVRCENNNIIFRELESGRELTPDESNRI